MSHDHGHDHESSAAVSNRVKRLVAVLERSNIVSEAQLDDSVEAFLLKSNPGNGGRVVARAWVDQDFKGRLLENASVAVSELGIDLSHWSPVVLRAVENTPEHHNVIVCTLCSCYPVALLGPSPAWYKSLEYRAAVVRDPRGVLAQFGCTLPEGTKISVWDSTSDLRYIVIPQRPTHTEGMTEEQLAALVTRNGMIGTAAI